MGTPTLKEPSPSKFAAGKQEFPPMHKAVSAYQ